MNGQASGDYPHRTEFDVSGRRGDHLGASGGAPAADPRGGWRDEGLALAVVVTASLLVAAPPALQVFWFAALAAAGLARRFSGALLAWDRRRGASSRGRR